MAKRLLKGKVGESVGLLAAFLLAISPWHLYLSRLGHEVNAGLTLSILGILFFLNWVVGKGNRRLYWLFSSVILFSLSLYTYQSLKIFLPLLLLGLVYVYRRVILKQKKVILLAGVLGLVLLLPLIKASLAPGAAARYEGTSIFANSPVIIRQASERLLNDRQGSHWLGLIFDNRRLALSQAALKSYASHFNPTWLFFNAGQENHKIPGMGLLYLWELPFLLWGAYQLISRRKGDRVKRVFLIWILVAPISAAITTQAPHAMRFFNVIPVPQILVGIGLLAAWQWLKKQNSWFKRSLTIFSLLFLTVSFSHMLHNYFINYPFEQSASFQLPLARSIKFAQEIESDYSEIIFTHHDQAAQAYMFYLFFSRYSPQEYLSSGGTQSAGFDQSHQIGRYQFRTFKWQTDPIDIQAVYFGNPGDFPDETPTIGQFNAADGTPGILAVKGNDFLGSVEGLNEE